MATYKSTGYTIATDGTGKKAVPTSWNGVTSRYEQYIVLAAETPVGSGDMVEIMTIPAGVRILPQSFVIISDLEASATVDVGYKAHTTQSTGAAVAVDDDAFCSVIAADSARTVTHFHESGTHDAGYITTGEMVLTLSLGAGTAVTGDTFDFHIMYTDPN
jgi:hypothetical protein|tara:strand:- start:878 stop:1357 length:480 start_codon:yes stop_codon:yes gene_type:complete